MAELQTNDTKTGHKIFLAHGDEFPKLAQTSNYKYKDYSQIPVDEDYGDDSKQIFSSNNHHIMKSSVTQPTFPVKLHQILSNPEFRDIISWLPHGRSWRVLDPKMLEEKIIPLHFRHCRYSSFMRQVNGWGFKRIFQGVDVNSYYHEFFLRGLPHLCPKMRRPTGKEARIASAEAARAPAPDFYSISQKYPLPPQQQQHYKPLLCHPSMTEKNKAKKHPANNMKNILPSHQPAKSLSSEIQVTKTSQGCSRTQTTTTTTTKEKYHDPMNLVAKKKGTELQRQVVYEKLQLESLPHNNFNSNSRFPKRNIFVNNCHLEAKKPLLTPKLIYEGDSANDEDKNTTGRFFLRSGMSSFLNSNRAILPPNSSHHNNSGDSLLHHQLPSINVAERSISSTNNMMDLLASRHNKKRHHNDDFLQELPQQMGDITQQGEGGLHILNWSGGVLAPHQPNDDQIKKRLLIDEKTSKNQLNDRDLLQVVSARDEMHQVKQALFSAQLQNQILTSALLAKKMSSTAADTARRTAL